MDMSTNETTTEAPVSIIGFGAAGFNTAIALRTSGYTGPIRMFSDIDTLPYSPSSPPTTPQASLTTRSAFRGARQRSTNSTSTSCTKVP